MYQERYTKQPTADLWGPVREDASQLTSHDHVTYKFQGDGVSLLSGSWLRETQLYS